MTEKFKKDFLGSSSQFCNVQIICSDGLLHTHKLLLAASGRFIKFLLEDTADCEDVTLIMTEFRTEDIEKYLDQTVFQMASPLETEQITEVENLFKSKPPDNVKRETDRPVSTHIRKETDCHPWGSSNEDEDSQEASYDSEFDKKLTVKMEQEDQEEKDTKQRNKKKLLTPLKSCYPARSVVNIDELSKQIIPNPLTPTQVKKNEWIEKQIRHERAVLAYLG